MVHAHAQDAGRVLVADDSRVVRAAMRLFLEGAGLEVEEASDGDEALERLRAGSFDVVVTDLNMPHRDGFGLMEAAQGLDRPPEMIVLTGTHAGDIRSAVRALRLGAHDFLTKPPGSADDVVATVRRAIEKRRSRDANARLVHELEELSRTDGLTGVGNRRAFEETLRTEESRASRYDQSVALIMLDVDHFKAVNDRLGHPAGDSVLEWLPRVIAPQLRDGDGLFRYGGEEFAVLLPHASLAAAQRVAQRVIEAVAAEPARVAGTRLRVTCSAGVASVRGADAARGALVQWADAALYAAKTTGRNRVVADGPAVAVPRVRRAVPADVLAFSRERVAV